ncbi:TOMM precursor leader peptide-binding protein [Streptomyces sp. NPDC059917]|uniref:TOMM precursor leader peptide-binding protein n=1 Tax=Streptomyces sp. NPDC059917 TaxID=3347002 RepID=UPI0036595E8D
MALENGRGEPGPDTRIFLRQDSVFLESEDGVFLRSGAGDFFVAGPQAYAWLSRLARDLAGGTTLRELCGDLPEERAGVLSGLVRHLAGNGFVRLLADEPDTLLDAAEQEAFAEQLAYLAHHTDTPRAALRRVRDARVAVLGGSGPDAGARAAVRTLARNGVGHLALLGPARTASGAGADGEGPADGADPATTAGERARVERLAGAWTGGWREALTAWRPTAIIATADGVPGAALRPLADLAHRTGAALLTARSLGDLVLKGPLAPPPGARDAACWHCAALQLAEHADPALAALILREDARTASRAPYLRAPGTLTPLLSAAVASELATELFKYLSGAVAPDLVGAVVVQRGDTLETWRERLPVRADCPSCAAPVESALKELRAGALDLPGSPEDRLTRYRSVLGRTTALLRAFDDDDLPQTPVRSGLVRTAELLGPGSHGFSVSTSHEARARAVERALRHAAALAPAPLPVRRATEEGLRATGARVAGADGPAGVTAPEAERDWTPALRLRDDAVVWVPLERALETGGVGVGATVREVVGSALAARLLAERLRDWLDGLAVAGPVVPADHDPLYAPSTLALIRTGRLTLQVLDSGTGDGPPVVLARHATPDGAVVAQVAAIGPDRRAAVATAVLELSGLVAHPEAARGPGGPYHLVCGPDWPAPTEPPLAPEHLASEPSEPSEPPGLSQPPEQASTTEPGAAEGQPAHQDDRADLGDLLHPLGADRDALLLELAPAGLPRTPAGDRAALVGRVLLVDAPPPHDRS